MRLKNGNFFSLMVISLIVIIVGLIRYPYFKPPHSDNIKSYELGLHVLFTGIFVDSKENFYIGFDTGIYCYSSSGEYLYKLVTPNTTGSFDFIISDDIITVWEHRTYKKYSYSLSGDLFSVEKYEASDLPIYKTSFDHQKAWQNDKIIYRYHSIFGFWWVTNETGKCLTHIPVFMFILKKCLLLEFICLWILLSKNYNTFLKTKGNKMPWKLVPPGSSKSQSGDG